MGSYISPVLCKVPIKKNTQNLKSKRLIQLQPLGDEEKQIFSDFKNNKKIKKENVDIDLKRVDELTNVRKREHLHVRDSDSPLKPVFKQSKKLGGKGIENEKKIKR